MGILQCIRELNFIISNIAHKPAHITAQTNQADDGILRNVSYSEIQNELTQLCFWGGLQIP